jgi:hypothetical protein
MAQLRVTFLSHARDVKIAAPCRHAVKRDAISTVRREKKSPGKNQGLFATDFHNLLRENLLPFHSNNLNLNQRPGSR